MLVIDLVFNVCVNGIVLGVILWLEWEMDEDEKDKLILSILLGELGILNDIVKILLFLVLVFYIIG